ncbi:hypothetical protein [Streptomyces roseolilacinus]|uniref:Uncharacterized protein n=1 Tax=Streptomyces roseolilacinus TaxID=66904 RepID=A0A918EKX8_9ACTN|nr:hypothetical protein [Streptomyces roseolilacinus]GGQ01589.1 hypothetical protein GCM10010249_20040 [Streptomyces roseolilacinus]
MAFDITADAPVALASLYDHFGLPHTRPAARIGGHLDVAAREAEERRPGRGADPCRRRHASPRPTHRAAARARAWAAGMFPGVPAVRHVRR